MRAYLGLGSNMGDRWSFLRNAVASIPDLKKKSHVYESAAVGGPPQPPYLNAVVELDTRYEPRMLLRLASGLELRAGRKRDPSVRWGPRTLDVDVLWVEGWQVDEVDLKVPHPRMWERAFVVAPLSDLAPDLVKPDKRQWALRQVTRQQGTL